MELLKECNKLPDFQGSGVEYIVCAFSPDLYGAAAKISARLRACRCIVDLIPSPKKNATASFKHADQTGAKRMVFVAPDEISKGVVRIQDLRTKHTNGDAVQVDCPLDKLDRVEKLVAEAAAR